MSVVELISAAEGLKAKGDTPGAMALYRAWIAGHDNDPLMYAVLFNYGVTLTDTGDVAAAKAAFVRSIAIKPDFIPSYINLGSAEERSGAIEPALNHWNHVVGALNIVEPNNINYKITALKQIGRVLENAQADDTAESVLRQGLEINPHQRDAAQHFIALRQRQCKWPVIAPWSNVSKQDLISNISPLSLAVLSDDPLFQLANSYHYNKNDVVVTSQPFTAGGWTGSAAPRKNKLKIGYVSSDLRNHAVGFLTTEVFELHDPDVVEIHAYYCGIRTQDATQDRIKASVHAWTDINDMTDKQVARKIIDDGIDILVDLNGYTKDARTKVFALRPAPVLVNWLGFPGSMGSPYHNYIIADDFIIPREHESYYTEGVMRLPCYQPTDRKRTVSARIPARSEVGLPEDATVFCVFNGMQKITKPVFLRWISILKQVPNSVLWMLAGGADTHQRLRDLAAAEGIAPERLIFAERMANADHLARYQLADLFLDTFPYGAHTTASDAMWMGVPVLTMPGRSFASRVCGSLVRAAGLDDLICKSPDDYVARAVTLGTNPKMLAAYKAKLRQTRDSSVLFDIPGLVRQLERLYGEMWQAYAENRLPQPDLTNLAAYHQVGCLRDQETGTLLSTQAYRHAYQQALAYHRTQYPLPADQRVLTASEPLPLHYQYAAE